LFQYAQPDLSMANGLTPSCVTLLGLSRDFATASPENYQARRRREKCTAADILRRTKYQALGAPPPPPLPEELLLLEELLDDELDELDELEELDELDEDELLDDELLEDEPLPWASDNTVTEYGAKFATNVVPVTPRFDVAISVVAPLAPVLAAVSWAFP